MYQSQKVREKKMNSADFPYTEQIIKSKIIDIRRTCDLVMFTFELINGEKLHMHIQSFIRIFDNDKLIICTQDMLRRSCTLKRKQKFDWSKTGNTLFDDTIEEYREKLYSACVKNFLYQKGDFKIYFDNGMIVDVLMHITESDDPDYSENYRIFDEDEEKEHFVR